MTTELAEEILTGQREEQEPSASEPQHTEPTAEDLTRMVGGAPFLLGGRRDGSMFCEIAQLPEGYAFRPYGSGDDAWQWLRTEDFERSFVGFGVVDMRAVDEAIRELAFVGIKWQSRCRGLMKLMGKKSRRRLGKKLVDAMNGNDT